MLGKALKDAQAKENGEVIKTVFGLLCYMKFEEDSLIQKNYSKYRFIDEREFRLCPSFEELQEAGDDKQTNVHSVDIGIGSHDHLVVTQRVETVLYIEGCL